jgi:hypothetical protein
MSPLRRLIAAFAFVILGAAVSGCSDDGGGPNGEPPITQEAADDIMQQFAMSFALDHGGWQADMESASQSTPRFAAQRMKPMAFAFHSGGRGFGIMRDTSFTRAAMTYSYNYLYTDYDPTRPDTSDWFRDSLATWSPLVVAIEGRGQGNGTIDVDTTFAAVFRHTADELNIIGIGANDDTMAVFGSTDDSLFTTFRPQLRASGDVYYVFTMFGDVDDVAYLRDGSNPYPIEGNIEAFVFADHLASANPTDLVRSYSGELRVNFDGTLTPIATFSGEVDDPSPPFRYRINLRTGAITRL